jgi:hypothetical protein
VLDFELTVKPRFGFFEYPLGEVGRYDFDAPERKTPKTPGFFPPFGPRLWRSDRGAGSDLPCGRHLSSATSETHDRASDRHSSIAIRNAAGVNGLRRQREAPSSSAILRKSGAGEVRFAKA